jgi:hypothetical protein
MSWEMTSDQFDVRRARQHGAWRAETDAGEKKRDKRVM